ncbi:E3 ubiquitin-protein ligase RING1-like [Rhododendron vialii]|uniref:E3 ubiquitin-protein ligase RING1-like n=1 Tax=Rhododendron vialii TaxID=182163 RepID=UPI00265E58ED|nr:E3 ubiquitin-protein ligase RING1-like [Rhododendron vialii]
MPTHLSPPPPPPPPQYNMPVFYYGLLVVGTTGIILALYNLIIIRLCTGQHHHLHRQSRPGPPRPANRTPVPGSSRSFDNQNTRLMSSFKYKKGEGALNGRQDQQDYELECPVCLSVVEEGEEVRQLPRCKHSFHAPCIDMWLYSHFDCPVCRAPVEPPVLRLHTAVMDHPSENSREGMIDAGNLV